MPSVSSSPGPYAARAAIGFGVHSPSRNAAAIEATTRSRICSVAVGTWLAVAWDGTLRPYEMCMQ